jgi:hypothetical protein
VDKTNLLRAVQDDLVTLRAEYAVTHEEAMAAFHSKDFDRLIVLSASENRIVTAYCMLIETLVQTVKRGRNK